MLSPAQVERVHTLLRKTGQFIQHHSARVRAEDVEEKELNSLVSFVDKQAEERLVEGLSFIVPEATFLTEEGTVEQKDSDLKWIIDPLDGTTNFLHGIPSYAISVGLEKENELVAGFVYDIPFENQYWAIKSEGAYKNKEAIKVSQTARIKDSLIATGFPYQDFAKMDAYMKLLSRIMENTRGIRRLGSAAIDLAYTAEGRFDIFYEYGLNPWDVAGGAIIVQEAGGQVIDFNQGDNFVYQEEIIAGSPQLMQEFYQLFQKHFL